MADKLRYLTTQDLLWLNMEITGEPQSYRFDKLEEVTAYQYSRGHSDPHAQAARFALGWRRHRPFHLGNEATGFVATLAFLYANDIPLTLKDDEALSWWRDLPSEPAALTEVLRGATQPGHVHAYHNVVDYKEILLDILEAYPKTIAALRNEAPTPMREMARTRLTGELIR